VVRHLGGRSFLLGLSHNQPASIINRRRALIGYPSPNLLERQMERKNIKVYGILLNLSIVLQWLFIDVVEGMESDIIMNNLELINSLSTFIPIFFYTMIVLTIQALIHNVILLEDFGSQGGVIHDN
jgi:hypothetical protein